MADLLSGINWGQFVVNLGGLGGLGAFLYFGSRAIENLYRLRVMELAINGKSKGVRERAQKIYESGGNTKTVS